MWLHCDRFNKDDRGLLDLGFESLFLLALAATAASMSAASLVAEFLNSPEGGESPAVAQLPAELAQLIVAHQANLLDIVRASGEYLTSEDDERRGRGGSLLESVRGCCGGRADFSCLLQELAFSPV